MKKKDSLSQKDKEDWKDFLENTSFIPDKDKASHNRDSNQIYKFDLHGLTLSDANTKTDPVVDNETIYGSSQLDAESNQFFSDLESENTYLAVTIPVLDDDLNIPIINEPTK